MDRHKSTLERVFQLYPWVEGKQIILFVGRVSNHKNIHTLLEAFFILRKKLQDVVLMIVGDYHNYMYYYIKLLKMVKSKGLEKDVIFAGIVPWEDLPLYYSASSIYATCTEKARVFDNTKPRIRYKRHMSRS